MNFLDQIKSIAESEQSTGSKVCRVEVMFGYKCYVQGADYGESFFPISNLEIEDEKQIAKNKAVAYMESTGVNNNLQEGEKKKRPLLIVALVVKPDGILTGYVYEQDKWYMYPTFAESFNVIAPSLELLPPPGLGTHWVKLGFVADPSGATYTNEAGEQKTRMVAYIDAYYPSKQEAQAEADKINADRAEKNEDSKSTISNSSNEDVPNGWTKIAWDAFKPDLAEELKTSTPKQVADNYDIGIQYVVQVKKEYGI